MSQLYQNSLFFVELTNTAFSAKNHPFLGDFLLKSYQDEPPPPPPPPPDEPPENPELPDENPEPEAAFAPNTGTGLSTDLPIDVANPCVEKFPTPSVVYHSGF